MDENTAPSVTVIIPVLNGAQTIEPLLESLQKQDYDKNKIEVIVVDGNSTDKTRDIVENFPVKLVVESRDGLNLDQDRRCSRSGPATG